MLIETQLEHGGTRGLPTTASQIAQTNSINNRIDQISNLNELELAEINILCLKGCIDKVNM